MSDRIDTTGYPPPASFGCPSCAALRAEVERLTFLRKMDDAVLKGHAERADAAEAKLAAAQPFIDLRVELHRADAQRDALREALENIADKDFDCQDPSCGLPVPVCKDIAAAALEGK